MELKHRLGPRHIFIALYFAGLAFYIIIGLNSVKATDFDVDGQVIIPNIGLYSDVTRLTLSDGKIDTPDEIVGSYQRNDNKTLLVGHSSTIFTNLDLVSVNDNIIYNSNTYRVLSSEVLEKSGIRMNELLRKSPRDTLVIMTCAGETVGDKDATHRLIITAVRI